MSGQVQWTIVAAPNEGWATQVFGEPDLERLWEAVSVAMRLDAGGPEDVVEEWRRHRDRLGARARALTDLRLDAVRYHGEGTDLTAGLIAGLRVDGRRPGDRRRGGLHAQPADRGGLHQPGPAARRRRHPDDPAAGAARRRRAGRGPRGHVRQRPRSSTRPRRPASRRSGPSSTATRAPAASARCRWSRARSRVRAAGVTFHDTLFDENTGCHVAWGTRLPVLRPRRPVPKSPDELRALGLNFSVRAHRRGHRRPRASTSTASRPTGPSYP